MKRYEVIWCGKILLQERQNGDLVRYSEMAEKLRELATKWNELLNEYDEDAAFLEYAIADVAALIDERESSVQRPDI